MNTSNLGTRQKALALNLDARTYGTIAEIGGGQEVARWFFNVGGAAGTVGRAAVVLPDGALFGEGVKTRLKEHLLEECNLHTIVRLPSPTRRATPHRYQSRRTNGSM